jgi:hypothetical protein
MIFLPPFLDNKNHLLLRYGGLAMQQHELVNASGHSTRSNCGAACPFNVQRRRSHSLSTPVCLAVCVAIASMSGGDRQS